jgi:hypothetical protein
VIALDSRFAALAAFQSRDLFAFAVQLLNFPAEAAHLLCGLGGVLSRIVGDDPIRATGRRLNSETAHLVVSGKVFDLDRLAGAQFGGAPFQRIHTLVRELLLIHDVGQHLADVIELGFAIAFGIVDATILGRMILIMA